LLSKVPDFAADILPDKGVLGVIKNLIDGEPDLSQEERAQLHRELVELI
jgi:hypothetical protein